MSVKIGIDGVLTYLAGGQDQVGTYTEIDIVQDVTLTNERGEADITSRASGGYRETIGTVKDLTLEFSMHYDPTDAGFTAFKNAYDNNTILAIQVLDGPSGEGYQADFRVTRFNINQPIENAQTVDVTCRTTPSATAPQWVDTSS